MLIDPINPIFNYAPELRGYHRKEDAYENLRQER